MPEALPATDVIVAMFAHQLSDTELPGTRYQCRQCQQPHHVRVEMAVHHRTQGQSDGNDERYASQVERQASAPLYHQDVQLRQELP